MANTHTDTYTHAHMNTGVYVNHAYILVIYGEDTHTYTYYAPQVKHADIHHPQHMQILNETANGTAAASGDNADFVCTLANIQALAAEVQVSMYRHHM